MSDLNIGFPFTARSLPDLEPVYKAEDVQKLADLIEQQQQRIEELEQVVEYVKDSRSRYAKYFNAFCWFLEDHGSEPMHSDNHPKVLENQLHTVVKDILDERDQLAVTVERLRDKFTKANTWEDVREAFASTPQQNFNALKREVATKAYVACADEYGLEHAHASKQGIIRNSKEYANTKYPSGKD